MSMIGQFTARRTVGRPARSARFLAFLATMIVSLLLSTGGAAAASSPSEPQSGQVAAVAIGSCKIGQTTTRLGLLQIELCGSGTEAHFIEGVLLKPKSWVCNMEFRIFGVGRDGRHWQSNSQIAKCSWNGTYVDWNRAFEFADNTNVCMEVGVHGQGWEPYYACLHIKA